MSTGNRMQSARQLTTRYFSILAFAIIAIHFSLLDSTLDDLEQLHAYNRLQYDTNIAVQGFNDSDARTLAIPPFSHAYRDISDLPAHLIIPIDLPNDEAVELKRKASDDTEYFIMQTEVRIKNQPQRIYLLYFNEIYESSEQQIIFSQAKHLVISIVLIGLSFLIISRLSQRLTNPLARFADEVEGRSVNDPSPIAVPSGLVSKELEQLVLSFNSYTDRIHQLLKRERAFNRYASHELRTPLMVMKGAISLLGQSNDPAFINKQRTRLRHATNDMNDFVTTLLTLTKEEAINELTPRPLTLAELEAIASEHLHLLADKPVSWDIVILAPTLVSAPPASIKILLGNLLKNAFACTETGSIRLEVSPDAIRLIDTGIGLDSKPRGVEGYGLGLLIASDICRKYGWQLNHSNNTKSGCTAEINLRPL